jgi:hypothetical protein
MDLKVGTKVRFLERHTPPYVRAQAIGVVVSIDDESGPQSPMVRVRFENYLSGWIFPHQIVCAEDEFGSTSGAALTAPSVSSTRAASSDGAFSGSTSN